MRTERWKTTRTYRIRPKCIFCDVTTELAVILRISERAVKGWRCPKCGFTLAHRDEISKVIELFKQEMKVS